MQEIIVNTLTDEQQNQEQEYFYPYHYTDLKDKFPTYLNIGYVGYLHMVQQMISTNPEIKVLDAGCGDGRFCFELNRNGFDVVGIDYSEQAIAFAKAFNPSVEFHVQDLTNLTIEEKFDYVISIETLEHIIPEHIPDMMRNIRSRLKPKGKFIITVPSVLRTMEKKHFQHFTTSSLTEALHPYFRVLDIYGYGVKSIRRKWFMFLLWVGFMAYPLRHRWNSVKRYYQFLHQYQQRQLMTGPPEKCTGLVALCEAADTNQS